MWEYTQQEELYHYGVPGMRWGVKKAQAHISRSTGHIKKVNAKLDDKAHKVHAKLNGKLNKANAKLNAKSSKVNSKLNDQARKVHKLTLDVGKLAAAPILATVGTLPVSKFISRNGGNAKK